MNEFPDKINELITKGLELSTMGKHDEAESYFEGLRKAGILWDLPEAAAAKVEEIYDDPWAWWGSTVVQETRQIFVDRFASGRKDWVGFWVKALEEEMALSQIKEQ